MTKQTKKRRDPASHRFECDYCFSSYNLSHSYRGHLINKHKISPSTMNSLSCSDEGKGKKKSTGKTEDREDDHFDFKKFTDALIEDSMKMLDKRLLSYDNMRLSLVKDFKQFKDQQLAGRKVRDILEQYQAVDALEIMKLKKEIESASNHSSFSSKSTVWSVEQAGQTNKWTAGITMADELKLLKDSTEYSDLNYHHARLVLEQKIIERNLIQFDLYARGRGLVYDVAGLMSVTSPPLPPLSVFPSSSSNVSLSSSSSSSSFASGGTISTLTFDNSTSANARMLGDLYKVIQDGMK
jgi:hypothetical protein